MPQDWQRPRYSNSATVLFGVYNAVAYVVTGGVSARGQYSEVSTQKAVGNPGMSQEGRERDLALECSFSF